MTAGNGVAPNQGGTVVLDIGGDIGALVLVTSADLLGAEIEISPLDDTALDVFQQQNPHVPEEHEHENGHVHTHDHPDRTHVAVRERRGPAGVLYAAVYPGLRRGQYQLWNVDGTPGDVVVITGGEVAQLDWS